MEKLIIEEICKNLKWYERIVVKVLAKLFVKVYNKERIKTINLFLEEK